MKIISLIFFIISYSNILSQDIVYTITPPQIVYADSFDHVYRFFSHLNNNTTDTVAIQYNRVKKDILPNNIFNGLCTDILCYAVNSDSIVEYIPPMTVHKIESRWMVTFEDIDSGRGYSEWEVSLYDSQSILDTFKTEFVYTKTTNTLDIELNDLIIYPNPVGKSIRFSESDLEQVKIFNISGELKQSAGIVSGHELDVSKLVSSHYYGIAIKGNRRFNFRFIKI